MFSHFRISFLLDTENRLRFPEAVLLTFYVLWVTPINFYSYTAIWQNWVLRLTLWISCSRQSLRAGSEVSQVNVRLLKNQPFFFKLMFKQVCTKIWQKLGQRRTHNMTMVTVSAFGCVNDCIGQWQIPTNVLWSNSRPTHWVKIYYFRRE